MANDRVICPAPFTTLMMRPSLDRKITYSCCCNFEESTLQSLDILRANIKNRVASPGCKKCYEAETQGGQSERQRLLTTMPDSEFFKFVHSYEPNEREIFIKFSNLCPLSCRSCQPDDSTGYARTLKIPILDYEDLGTDPDSWTTVIDYVTEFSQHERPILHLIGGEILVQPGVIRLLEWMNNTLLSSRFILRATTSLGTNLSSQLQDLLLPFAEVCLNLSIDSVNENYHYVRWPANFQKVQQNLQILIDLKTKLRSYLYIIQPLYSINNIFYIKDQVDYSIDWIKSNNIRALISPIQLNYPDMLSLAILPVEYKMTVVDLLTATLNSIDTAEFAILRNHLESLINIVSSAADETKFQKFLEFTADFDKRTKTAFEIHNERFWRLLSPEHKNHYRNCYA